MIFFFLVLLLVALPDQSRAEAGKPEAAQSPPTAAKVADTTDHAVTEQEFKKLQEADDTAQAEVDKWKAAQAQKPASGAANPTNELRLRIEKRLAPVRQAYEDFLSRHPSHVEGHLTFGSFLNDQGDEAGAQVEWEKALSLDPKNAAAYYNLANRYAEIGPLETAFKYYARAIELKPSEGAYYHGYADALYVRRKGAMKYFGISEQKVYTKSLGLYQKAKELDPRNFLFATDLAQTYYAVAPLPADDALNAWTNALKVASNGSEREIVCLHLARVKMLAGKSSEARAQLSAVTNDVAGKAVLLQHIAEREKNSAK